MVALAISLLVTLGLTALIAWYGLRVRPPGTPLSWGEAMGAATFVFLVMFLAYGVVPHQWLTWADNELNWRADRFVLGPGRILDALPFTVTYQVVRDIIAAGIYIVFLGVQIALWSIWQRRGQTRPKELPTSAFGRPLVKGSS
jgi:hypothetical protein